MKLFSRKDFRLQVEPIVFSIKAFKKLEARDRTVNKSQLEKELAFIYFVYDPRSDLQFIVDEQERIERVKELIGLDNKFKIDSDLQKAIDVYQLMTNTTSSDLVNEIRIEIDKIKKYLRDSEINDDTFVKRTDIIIKMMSLSDKLSDLERKVVREVEEISNARGDKAMSILDQGFDGLFK